MYSPAPDGSRFVVVAHLADGRLTTHHPTKKAAHAHGRALRATGIVAFVYPTGVAAEFGLTGAS